MRTRRARSGWCELTGSSYRVRLAPLNRAIPAAALLALSGCASSAPAPSQESPQAARESRASGYRYLLYRPAAYDETQERFPLILFLHGGGERGDDLDSVRREALPRLIEYGQRLPFLVVSPQESGRGDFAAVRLDRLLDDVVAENRVDDGRIYATGLSSGALAALELAILRPERFAALAVVASPRVPDGVCALRPVPVRIYHGDSDSRVPLSASRRLRDALEACGASAELVVYQGDGHDAWTRAYGEASLYEWFLQNGVRSGVSP